MFGMLAAGGLAAAGAAGAAGGGGMSAATIGSLAGSAIGAGGGLLESREQGKNKKKSGAPKLDALHNLAESIKESQAMRQRALIALGQAHMDYASMF